MLTDAETIESNAARNGLAFSLVCCLLVFLQQAHGASGIVVMQSDFGLKDQASLRRIRDQQRGSLRSGPLVLDFGQRKAA